MAEMERTRERERGAIPETPYEIFIRSRREFLERQETGQVVVKPSDREFYLTRQGRLMYHLNPEIHKNTPLQDWRVFSHDLKTQSGKHRHQGGLVIYVIIGKGYSVVDGERVDWQAGDLLLLPIKPGGVEHQHFNSAGLGLPLDRILLHAVLRPCRHRNSRRPRYRRCSRPEAEARHDRDEDKMPEFSLAAALSGSCMCRQRARRRRRSSTRARSST